MLATIKSEALKLFTIRSTYVMIILSIFFLGLYAFYFEGYRGNTGSAASQLAPTAYQEVVTNGGGMIVLFVSIIAILFMAHEYRYNTITYTLTANTRRSQVLASKLLVTAAFSVLYGLLAVGVALGMYMLGLQLRDAALPEQDFNALAEFGRVAVYYVAYGLIGLLLAALLRNIVGAIGTLFGLFIVAEPLLGLVLKENAAYLPITATDTILRASMMQSDKLTPNEAILVSGIYLAVGWVIAWLLFLRRDAN